MQVICNISNTNLGLLSDPIYIGFILENQNLITESLIDKENQVNYEQKIGRLARVTLAGAPDSYV